MFKNQTIVESTLDSDLAGKSATFDLNVSISQRSRQRKELIWLLVYISPAVIILVIFSYIPLVRAIWLSLNITNAQGEPIRFNGLNYYARILSLDSSGNTDNLKSIGITFQFALLVVPVSVVLSILLAVLAAVEVKAIRLFRTIYTSSIAISLAVGSVIWSVIYDPNIQITGWIVDSLNLNSPGLLANAATAMIAVAVMTIWAGLGFNFIICLAGVQAIPQEIYDSGAIDGASGLKATRYLTLPLLTPTLLFLVIINTVQSFQAFTQFRVLMKGAGPEGSTNVFVYAIFKTFWYDNRYGLASAMSIILFMLLLIFTVLQFWVLDRRVHYQ